MRDVVITSREADASAYATLLYERIRERFGEKHVFMAIDAVAPGRNFADAVVRDLGSVKVMIVVIGRRWLVDAHGRRPLDDPADRVRIEITAALERGIRIIPVLVDGATMPAPGALPRPLESLARRNPLTLRSGSDIDALVGLLDERFVVAERAAPHAPPPASHARPSLRWPRFSFPWRRLIRRSETSRRLGAAELARKRGEGRSEPVRVSTDAGQPSPPAVRGDVVECTVFAPGSAAAGETLFVQVFAHDVERAEEARRLAQEFDADTERRAFKTLEETVSRGSTLTFDLQFRRLTVINPVQSLVWLGKSESVQFEAEVPENAKPGTAIGAVTVSIDSVPIGHVKFKLAVVPARAQPTGRIEPTGDDAKRYTTAFVSYSAEDRREVLERVQMLKPLGIHYFQDLLDLDPGDRWEQKLYLSIAECDLFLLFWSTDAKHSQWVRREVQYALDRKGGDDFASPAIRPVVIEGPPIPLPWPELAHLHFGDQLLYVIAGLDT